MRALSLAALAVVALALLAVPTPALAWGPLAHLNFSGQALANIAVVQPSLRQLLADFGEEFLYGSLAADIVVGKNLARYLYHCHNWRVGFNVLEATQPGAERAFAWGFLSHLAADTVAHNYYVPYKTVASFHAPQTKHSYWELRYDQRMDPETWRLARRIISKETRVHDDMLRRLLAGAYVLPFGLSKRLFGSLLLSARAKRFQGLSRRSLARERDLELERDLVDETERLAVDAILGLLVDGEKSLAARADPTGARNLKMASDLRRRLAARARGKGRLAEAIEAAQETRGSFRAAIRGPLHLPAFR